MIFSILRAAAYCCVLLFVLNAEAHGQSELRVSLRRDTGSADPLSPKSTLQLLPDLFLPLVRPPLIGGGAYQGALAATWQKLGATAMRLKLRSAKWSDGSHITSEDVIYTIEAIKKNVSSPFHDIVCQFGCWQIKAEGPLVVVITTSKPQNSLLDRLADIFIVPKSREGKSNWNQNPVVSGAYKIKSWKHQRHIVLQENPHALFPPQIKAKRYVFFRDLDGIARAVESKTIDAGYAAPEQQARFSSKKAFFVRKYPYPAAVTIALNRASKADYKALNKCLSASLDEKFKNYLVKVATLGAGQVARTFWHPDVQFLQFYAPTPVPPRDSVSTAKCSWQGRLLLITESGFEEYAKVAKILAKRLSVLNIRVDIKYIQASAIREVINFRRSPWDLYLGEFPTSRSPRFPDFSTSLASPPTRQKYSENIVSYQNPKALGAVRSIEHGHESHIASAFRRLAASFQEDPPAHPLYTVNDAYVFSKAVFVVGAEIAKVKINHVFRFYPETLSFKR